MGIGNTSSASLVLALLTDADLGDVVGPGTGLDAAGATSQGQTYVAEVDLMEANSEIDSVTADLMRLFGENLNSIFASPACQGSFVDDDNSIFEMDIEWLSARGVTKGCNADGTEFCPMSNVTRGQMAAFLARAFNLPDAGSSPFTDTAGSIFEAPMWQQRESPKAATQEEHCSVPTGW